MTSEPHSDRDSQQPGRLEVSGSDLPAEGLANPDFVQAAKENGISERTFYRLKKELEKSEKILLSKVTGKWMPISPKTQNQN